MSNIGFVKLDELTPRLYSAPPLVILNVTKLLNFSCFKNFRSLKFTLGIPIIFWNNEYLEKLNNIKFMINKNDNLSIQVVPPLGISSYKINWRRPDLISKKIQLDNSLYKYDFNYILPMSHTFIMEFNSGNSSEELCEDIKNSLITEPIQRQELIVEFTGRKTNDEQIPEIKVMLSDINIEPIRSECRSNYYNHYGMCYIYLDTAKKLSYEVAMNTIKRFNVLNINVQMKVYNMVLNEVCSSKTNYSSVSNRRIVGSSETSSYGSLICSLSSQMTSFLDNRISDKVVLNLNSLSVESMDHEFSMPVLN